MTYRNGDLSGIGLVADRCTAGIRRIRAPHYVIRDRDSVYDALVRARIKAMEIEEVVTAPRSPWQKPFVERAIGSIRRECLDHVIVLNERHLRRVSANSDRGVATSASWNVT